MAVTHQRLGWCLAEVGRQPEAAAAYRGGVQHYRAAIERSPKVARYRQELLVTYLGQAAVERDLGRHAEAAASALEARALGPDPSQLYLVARELALAAARIGPGTPSTDVDALAARNRYLEQSCEVLEEVIAAFTKAVDLNPNDPVACNYLAWLYTIGPEKLRNAEKALPLARKVVELRPRNVADRKNLGMACYRAGQYEEALRILVPIADARADEVSAHALFFLAMTHQRLGEPDKARAAYDKVIQWWQAKRPLPGHLPEMWAMQTETETLLGIEPSLPIGIELPPIKHEKEKQPPPAAAELGAG